MRHHEDAIDVGVARYSVLPGAVAIIVVGSVARGEERPDSDIDLYLVVTEEDYAARSEKSFGDFTPELYENAYFDVKVTTLEQLRAAERHADEPMRASFEGARVVWAASAGIRAETEALATAIPGADEDHWTGIMAAFAAQARLHGGYFLGQGAKLENRMLLHHAAVHLAFSIGRAVLAHDRILFAGPKYLEARLARAPLAPEGFVHRLRAFLDDPTAEEGHALLTVFESLTEWPLAGELTLTRFIEDNEQAWLTGVIPPEYR